MKVGEQNTLTILRGTSVGLYLGDDEGNDVLLPHKYIPEDAIIGKEIDVFIYRDSEDRLIATTLTPLVKKGEFAVLQVVAVNQIGAFLDWGLEKDLFLPFREQHIRLNINQYVPIFLFLDEKTDRLVASTKISKFFKNQDEIHLDVGQEVGILFYEKTDLGYNVVINNTYKGLVYENEIFKRVAWGDTARAYIKMLREEGKIDVSLRPLHIRTNFDIDSSTVLKKLQAADPHVLMISDKSDANEIVEVLEMSKKAFKRAIGILYKQKRINIFEDRIELIPDEA